MKKSLLFLVLVVSMALMLCFSANAMSGSGTEADPYIVESAEDFVAIKDNNSKYYKLNANISVSSTTGAIVENFSGVFDGNGKIITVTIDAPATTATNTFDSLFGVVSGSGVIKNVTVKGSIKGGDKVAGIAGKLTDTASVQNCVNYASINGRKNIGGIVGLILNSATIKNCVNYGEITSGDTIKSGNDAGGIVGCVWEANGNIVTISNCLNTGTVHTKGQNAGGICGFFYGGSIENCFNTGKTITDDKSTVSNGGIYGRSERWNGHSYIVTGYFSCAGDPLVGYEDGDVVLNDPMIESTGVAIYLGKGSGIRGEFHLDEDVFAAFAALASKAGSSVEYGALVSTKDVVIELGGDLISQAAKENDKVVFAPAYKNGAQQYFYTDDAKGEGYHSYRFAITGFDAVKEAYNTEFVILGYISYTDRDGNEDIICINTVESARLSSAAATTGFNAVTIVRVAEATIEDGDFEGNQEAIDALEKIVSKKAYSASIDIDGTTSYGHVNATFTRHESSDDTIVFKINNTNDEEFFKYIESLNDADYEKVFSSVTNGNSFYTYTNNGTLINIAYLPLEKTVTISKETVTNLPANLSTPSYNKTNNSSITQIKLADDISIKEGMSYVIHLEDGTFFIIDGGWCEDNYLEADKLYNTLVGLAGEGNDIVIAGWIFTHCHGDHIGTFNYFVEKYHDSVTINQLLYNFPSDDDILASASAYMITKNTKQRYLYFREMIATHLQDTEIVKLHSGYKFYYGNAEIEILQTFEDLYPLTVANYDYNSSSTIFTVTINGQRMLFVGDADYEAATRLNTTYGATLKSDFVQVAHHGLNTSGPIKTMYQYADAEYVFYPAPMAWYEANLAANANYYLTHESTTVKQVFISGAQTFKIELPYAGTLYDGKKFPATDLKTEKYDRVDRPEGTVTVPTAFFDLEFQNGVAVNAGTSKDTATVTMTGGSIKETTVKFNGEEKTATAFTKGEDGLYYLTVDFQNTFATEADWGNFIMGSSTFEVFFKLDNLPGKTIGIMTSCNAGGMTLYVRKSSGQINFQLGSNSGNSQSDNKGSYSAAVNMSSNGPEVAANELLHIVGSYNAQDNRMRLYVNGVCIADVDYGSGTWKAGEKNDLTLGIGYNPQYPTEEISSYTDYELYEARIYNSALSDEQVAQQYWNCIDNLLTEAE